MNDFGDIAIRFARNPLGIIGLAFVLVHGIMGYTASSDFFYTRRTNAASAISSIISSSNYECFL